MSADNLARVLSWRHPFGAKRRWTKASYQLHEDGTYCELQPRDWDRVVDALRILEADLERREAFAGELGPEWYSRSLKLLPAGVFVWRDELEVEYKRMYEGQSFFVERPGLPDLTEEEYDAALDKILRSDESPHAEEVPAPFDKLAAAAAAGLMTRPGDGELSFDPLLSPEERRLVLEGFEPVLHGEQGVLVEAEVASQAAKGQMKEGTKRAGTPEPAELLQEHSALMKAGEKAPTKRLEEKYGKSSTYIRRQIRKAKVSTSQDPLTAAWSGGRKLGRKP